MKREFLSGLGLEKETVDKIMEENGKDIEQAKSKYSDYDDLKATASKYGELEKIAALLTRLFILFLEVVSKKPPHSGLDRCLEVRLVAN